MANKIGTYLKALAARDNSVPFYVALPLSTIDWTIENGVRDIPIEKRAPEELTHVSGEGDPKTLVEAYTDSMLAPTRLAKLAPGVVRTGSPAHNASLAVVWAL